MKKLLLVLLLCLVADSVRGQDSFVEKQILFFSESPEPKAVFIADLNGDDFAEIVYDCWAINDSGFFPNLGDGTFDKTIKLPHVPGGIIGVADFDDDGDQDILTSSSPGMLLARNDGSGDFADTLRLDYDSFNYDAAVSDIDNNGLPDIVLGRADELRILYNQGNLNFTIQDVPIPGPGREVFVEDLDGNGLKDVVVRTNVYFQHTPGNFTEFNLYVTHNYDSITAADFSGDGKLDLFYSVYNSEIGSLFRGLAYFESSPDGFHTQVLYESERSLVVSSADIDGDGDLDLFTAFPENYENGEVLWIENNGDNIIEYGEIDLGGPAWVPVNRFFVVPGDLNNDGNVDLVFGEQFHDDISWFENTQGHSFDNKVRIADRCLEPSYTQFEDLDGDSFSLKDVLTYCPDDRIVAVCYQQINGLFSDPITLFESVEDINHLEAQDIDSDGDIDIVYSTDTELNYRLNMGNGEFSPPTVFSLDNGDITFEEFEIGQINGNGWADLVTRDIFNGAIVYLDFASSQSSNIDIPGSDFLNTGTSYHIHDFDKDGLMDVALLNIAFIDNAHFLYIYRQSADHSFSIVATTQILNEDILEVQFKDLNDDGLNDLNVLYDPAVSFPNTRLANYLNHDSFAFVAQDQSTDLVIPLDAQHWIENDIFDIGQTTKIFSTSTDLHFLNEQGEELQFDTLVTYDENIVDFFVSDLSNDGRDDIIFVDERRLVYYEQLNNPPVANFGYDDCHGIVLNVSSGNYLDGFFHWDFGNGYEETSFLPSAFPFDEPGTYLTSLVACTSQQCDTFEQVIEHSHVFDASIPTQGLVGEPISFENESSGYSNFTWVFGDGNVSTQQSPIHTYNAPGYYPVEFFATDNTIVNCTKIAADTLLIDWPVGFDMNLNNDIKVSPNPFNNGTLIRSPFENWTYTLFEANGRLLESGKSSESEFYLENNGWATGVYLLKIESQGQKPVVRKVVVN